MLLRVSPFREIEHTADWSLQVWGASMSELFVDAARGMYSLLQATPSARDIARAIDLSADDYESLLVAWLQELLYLTETDGLVFDYFRMRDPSSTRLQADVRGGPAAHMEKVIKAVTYHELAIRTTPQGVEATIVFDV